MPNLRKPPAERRGHAGTKDVELREQQPVAPRAPLGLLKSTRKVWRRYWASPVARAVDIETDLGVIERWIRTVDEYERVFPKVQEERVVPGVKGQDVLNPLAGYMIQLERQIGRAENELGLTPMARLRLGIAYSQAKRTVEKPVSAAAVPSEPVVDPRRALALVQ